MIPPQLRVTLCIAVVCYFIIILYYLKKRMLELKYTFWLLAGVVMGAMIYSPQLTVRFVRRIGMTSNMNGLYVMAIAFIICILMTLTSIVSRQAMKIKVLIQEISILEKRIRELEGISETKQVETKGFDIHEDSIPDTYHI